MCALSSSPVLFVRSCTIAAPADSPAAVPAAAAAAPPAKGKARGKRASKKLHAPMVPYGTVSDLEAVPKYIKGRLTLEQLNHVVDGVNGIVQAKYTLLSKPMTKLRGKELKAYTVRVSGCLSHVALKIAAF